MNMNDPFDYSVRKFFLQEIAEEIASRITSGRGSSDWKAEFENQIMRVWEDGYYYCDYQNQKNKS